jgi:hypothetical protein
VLTISGSGFATGATPILIFRGQAITVKSFTNTYLVAPLPSGTSQGTYQVTIRNSQGQSATVSTAFDVDAADVDPALVHDSTLKGNATTASPLGIAVPLTLKSPGIGITPLTIGPTSNGLDPDTALALPYGNIKITEGLIDVSSFNMTAVTASTFHGVIGIAGSGPEGVSGTACCDDTQASAGIYGSPGAFASSGAVAGYFDGNVIVVGNLSKAGGSFKIDHPLDPANKYLSHSFVESPDMKNIYDGTVITDATGFARVTMPEYVEALNRDFRYQLTVIGQFAQAIIGTKIAGNEFTIRTDKPGVEVSWQVTGIRQDAWANAHRIPVEQEKPEKERNSYLHPELFNQPVEKGVLWAQHPDIMKKHAEMMQKVMSQVPQHTAQ